MNLKTTYMGIQLRHPLIVGASPLSDDLDLVKKLEDEGAAAFVLRSLYEEEITEEHASEDELDEDASSEVSDNDESNDAESDSSDDDEKKED